MSESHDDRFARLMRAFGPALARLAAGYEADVAERQDLLQDIAVAVWRALPRFRGECSERTFIYRIAHNRGLTHRTRRQRFTPTSITEAYNVRDPRPDPEASLLRNEQNERLARAIRALDAGYRVVVLLTLEGLSNREVADVVGISDGNVAVRLTRARHRLRELLTSVSS